MILIFAPQEICNGFEKIWYHWPSSQADQIPISYARGTEIWPTLRLRFAHRHRIYWLEESSCTIRFYFARIWKWGKTCYSSAFDKSEYKSILIRTKHTSDDGTKGLVQWLIWPSRCSSARQKYLLDQEVVSCSIFKFPSLNTISIVMIIWLMKSHLQVLTALFGVKDICQCKRGLK